MWSLGILLYELLTGKSPFGSKTQEETCIKILKLDIRYYDTIPKDARDLIEKLLKVNPKDRPSLKEVLQHPFIVKNEAASSSGVGGGASDSANLLAENDAFIEVRRLKKCLAVAQKEQAMILQSKAQFEDQLLSLNDEVEAQHQLVRKERKKRIAAEHEVEVLRNELKRLRDGLEDAVMASEKKSQKSVVMFKNHEGVLRFFFFRKTLPRGWRRDPQDDHLLKTAVEEQESAATGENVLRRRKPGGAERRQEAGPAKTRLGAGSRIQRRREDGHCGNRWRIQR